MALEKLDRDYEKWSEELGCAIVEEFIEAVRLGMSLDNNYFHPERPRPRSQSANADVRAANEGVVDWADRAKRKLGRIKIDIVLESARQGHALDAIAEHCKISRESVEEIIRIWEHGPSAEQE